MACVYHKSTYVYKIAMFKQHKNNYFYTGVGAGVGGVKHWKFNSCLASHPYSNFFPHSAHVSLVCCWKNWFKLLPAWKRIKTKIQSNFADCPSVVHFRRTIYNLKVHTFKKNNNNKNKTKKKQKKKKKKKKSQHTLAKEMLSVATPLASNFLADYYNSNEN